MKRIFKNTIRSILFVLPLCIASCAPQLRDGMDITSSGFVDDNHYQAILVIDPDDAARGLVAKRESAYLKAKGAQLNDLALESLVNYCIDSQLQAGLIDRSRKDFDLSAHRSALTDSLKGMARHGKIAFVYYNEKNAMIIGYRVYSLGFRKRLDAIIAAPANGRQ